MEVLRQYFGFSSFREGQQTLVDAVLAGRDVLGVMPTGGGKSLCYELPALLLPGLRPEKLREKLSRRLPGKTGAAKFYGERVHKLYGLVIRCSNTLSPKHGRVPLTFFPWASISGELPPGHHILRAYNCGWRLLFPALRPPPSIWHGGNRRPG